MLRHLALFAALALAVPAGAQGDYSTLLARAQAGDTTVDYTALRMAYAESPKYSPYGTEADDLRDSLAAALSRGDFPAAAKVADAALAIDFLDVRAHMLRAIAADRLGDAAAAARHRDVAERVVASVLSSGDGSETRSYRVITVAEEYAVLGMTGFEPRRQSLGRCVDRRCDVMLAAHRESGEERTFHFDITLLYESMSKQIRGNQD